MQARHTTTLPKQSALRVTRFTRQRLAVRAATSPNAPQLKTAEKPAEGGGLPLLPSLVQATSRSNNKDLAQRTVERAVQNDVIEELELAQKAVLPPPDLSPYLQPVDVAEAKGIRMISSLCALTYHMHKLTPRSLYRLHRLRLVTTSRACEAGLREVRRSALETLGEADAMAADPALVQALAAAKPPAPAPGDAAAEGGATGTGPPLAAPGAASRAELLAVSAVAAELEIGGAAPPGPPGAGAASPAEVVAGSLARAASAAAAAATSVSASVSAAAASAASATSSATSTVASNIVSFTLPLATLPPVRSVAAQLQSAAASGHSTAVATVAAVSAALDSAWGRSRLPKECQSPTEWFVCDEEATHTRYFVIQGSDNLDHWRVNLTFDPVVFEDEELGVKVHRGVYEAAQALYDRFLPLLTDHLATSPFARVAFAGHSLGGSLGTLLMLMFVRRGVLPTGALAPVVTFGAPAILCEGAGCACAGAGGGGCGVGARRAGAGAGAGGILARLGLPEASVRNVMMHKDIVPRAFACDYSLVADLLRRVGGSFRDHACLQGDRQVMFNFIGQMMVLQPEERMLFVGGEGYHPMLPAVPGLFLLREPSMLRSVQRRVAHAASVVQECADAITAGAPSADVCAAGGPAPASSASLDTSCVIGSRLGPGAVGPAPPSARDALFQLMNNPHPLDTLGNSAAYGPAGQISRYHNPDNYTRALGGVLRARRAAWQPLLFTQAGGREPGLRAWHASAPQPMRQPGLQAARGGKLQHVRRRPSAGNLEAPALQEGGAC